MLQSVKFQAQCPQQIVFPQRYNAQHRKMEFGQVGVNCRIEKKSPALTSLSNQHLTTTAETKLSDCPTALDLTTDYRWDLKLHSTIGDKSVEKIVENRTTSRKSVVRVKFQAPSSPIQC